MINQDSDVHKTKFLPSNTAEPWNHSGQMLRDIKESLSHLRREKPAVLSTSSESGLPNVCAQTSYQTTTSTYLLSSSKCHPMQIKSDFASGGTVQQNTGSVASSNANGIVSGAYSAASDARVAGAVKSAHYRQKALAEIRNSLEPFANKLELSSSSSNASDSSGFSQTIDSVSSCPNGLDKDKLHNSEDLLSSMCFSKDLALRVLNFSLDKSEDGVVVGRDPRRRPDGCGKVDSSPDGLTGCVALSKINLKHLQKSTTGTQPDSGWEGSQSQFGTSSATESVRSDSPGASVIGLHHRLLPDAPKPVGNRNYDGSSSHVRWKRQRPIAFPSNDSPPPPPPPRGVAAPPPTPPKGATPPPPPPLSVSQMELRLQYGSNPLSSTQIQQLLKRKSPIPQNVTRSQALSYASSNSTPQRGTSPISFGRSVQHQQLVQQLQNLSVYSSGSSISSKNDLPPPYPASSSHSPASLSSMYSSPPPSTSSGKRSPTPTISSSEYSTPPFLQLQKRTPPPAYPSSSSSGSTHSSHPSSTCSIVGAATATMVTTVGLVPHFSYLQSWSSRQAKSQSPVIMQSVKSTHVQKPVLQTAVAPTSPPVCTTPTTFPVNNQQAINNNSISESSQTHTESNHINTYLSVQNPVSPPSYFSVQNINPRHLAINAQTSDQMQFMTIANNNISSNNLPIYPLHATTTNSAPPPPYSVSMQTQSVRQDCVNGLKPKQNQGISRHEILPGAQVPLSVPTTDPPSYACGVAALAVQRATLSMGNNLPGYISAQVTSSSQSNAQVPSSPNSVSSHLVNTVESICSSQSIMFPNTYNNKMNNIQVESHSYYHLSQPPPPLPKKPAPVLPDNFNSIAKTGSRPESPQNANQSPGFTNTHVNQVDNGRETRRTPPPPPHKKTMHQSPIPPRKFLSKEMEDERRETKIRNFSPTAFKFFMEQHIENLLKSHQQRIHRRQQLETEMAKVGLSEEAQDQMRLMLHQKESNYIRLKRAKMKKSMFIKIKTIGIGAFGEVALVKKVDTKQLYAMKTLRKADVFKRNQAAHVKAERDILAEADNEWVVKLYYSFQDKDNLYFVMDYIPGGDLMSLLIKFGIFQESLARFYITELVVAIESVHKMGFIHRDIKPDNILIDADGHIKLTDFGLCTGFRWTHNSKYYQRNGEHNRQDSMEPDENWNNECHCKSMKPLERRRRREHQRCLAHSLVGTPNYIAPEVLSKTGYTQHCDWWSVGVILYEMLVGQPPFFANTPAETQLKVVNWESCLQIPKAANLSAEAIDIILKLCCGPERRLGKNGADEIKAHPFFKSVNFNGDLRKQPAPYKPIISFPTDTSNFDPIDPDKLRSSDLSDDDKNEDDFDNTTHPEHAFFEFTFRRFFDDGGQAYPVKIPLEETADHGSSLHNESNSTYMDSKKPPVYV